MAVSAASPRPQRLDLPWHLRLLELASSYLPLLLMAVLALGTWWLVRNTPSAKPPQAAAPLRHEPDYEMTGFTVLRFGPDGALQAKIEGDELRHYPDTETLEIDNPRIRGIGPDGRVTLASARLALSNRDGSDVQLRGAAHVTSEAPGSEPPIEFRGEFLEVFKNTEQVRSPVPVTVTQGSTVVHAAGMDYDNLSRIVTLKGRMQGVFVPPQR
jgi:lipopolysaccharide export system protein LptC